jgi:hypothetical protein
MELPVPNCSMRHQNPVGDFDDTGHFLQGALCTIAAMALSKALSRGGTAHNVNDIFYYDRHVNP